LGYCWIFNQFLLLELNGGHSNVTSSSLHKKKLNDRSKFLSPKLAQSRWKKIPNQQASIRGVEQQQEEPTYNARGAKQHIWKIDKRRYFNFEEPCNKRNQTTTKRTKQQ
jgi:hypothetical protein